jgi:hypothetical protein
LSMFSNLHIYKTNSILQAAATGVDVSDIEVFIEHHRAAILLILVSCPLRVLQWLW